MSKILVKESKSMSVSLIPDKLSDWASFFANLSEKYPGASVEYDPHGDYGQGSIEIYWYREETDEEVQERIEKQKELDMRNEERDRDLYEKLKAKFEKK